MIEITDDIGFSVFWEHAGLFTFWISDYTFHFGVARSFWIWGHRSEVHFFITYWGIGPFFLVTRID